MRRVTELMERSGFGGTANRSMDDGVQAPAGPCEASPEAACTRERFRAVRRHGGPAEGARGPEEGQAGGIGRRVSGGHAADPGADGGGREVMVGMVHAGRGTVIHTDDQGAAEHLEALPGGHAAEGAGGGERPQSPLGGGIGGGGGLYPGRGGRGMGVRVLEGQRADDAPGAAEGRQHGRRLRSLGLGWRLRLWWGAVHG